MIDSVRGVTTHLVSNSTDAEPTTNAQILESFDAGDGSDGSAGFTLNGTDSGWNGNTSTYVAWCWKAGGTAVSNTDGTITSSVSANTDAGFSIVSYTGTGSNATVGHGLTTAPDVVVVKGRDFSDEWHVKHPGLSSNNHSIRFNSDASEADFSVWQNLAPTNSVFYIGSQNGVNQSTKKFIAYCWHSVEGYSKFGYYTGAAGGSSPNANGPYVYLGFKPAYLLIKRTDNASGGEWSIHDTIRDPSNANRQVIAADLANNEITQGGIDFLSNGFKIRDGSGWTNQTGGTYVYAAFSESPFGGQNVSPATAR